MKDDDDDEPMNSEPSWPLGQRATPEQLIEGFFSGKMENFMYENDIKDERSFKNMQRDIDRLSNSSERIERSAGQPKGYGREIIKSVFMDRISQNFSPSWEEQNLLDDMRHALEAAQELSEARAEFYREQTKAIREQRKQEEKLKKSGERSTPKAVVMHPPEFDGVGHWFPGGTQAEYDGLMSGMGDCKD
jgi:hypothetical protein